MAVDPARAKSLFLAASDLSNSVERAAFLDRECGDDSGLRDRVEALLRANDAAPVPPPREEGTAESANDPRGTEAYADPTARVGMLLAGKYKLVEEIGEGGMGSVFLAQQIDPVKRTVAVKVIKAGMDSKAVLARFDAERQALAMMDHPNIAKVLDAGTVGSEQWAVGSEEKAVDSKLPTAHCSLPTAGRPFFVMELVKGVPITKFCDERKLTPQQRLELFVPVCQAIQHAHQKGIIHRDIKPSNVLVALYDDRAVPKVIDFGVAKATGQSLTDQSLMTGFGAVVGTPEYMSPEQASLNNLDIDTRSDVYSLGVLLYELLTGTTPVDRKSLKAAALLEILRIVREVEAPRPSAKLSTIDTLADVAAKRSTEPAKLSRLMRGELDWVLMKALEKDRSRRYETANSLSRDIQRYLADELVEARPPSLAYRWKKFVRRNRPQLIAASLVAFGLITGLGVSLWQMKRAIDAEELAKKNESAANVERDAKTKALEAEKTARQHAITALSSMTDNIVERKFAQGAVLTEEDKAFLRSIIAQFDAFAAIQADDAASRETRAVSRGRIGTMRVRLGEFRDAEADYDAALAIYKQLTVDYPTKVVFREALASTHNNRGNLLYQIGRLKEAEMDFDAAVALYKQLATEIADRPELRQYLAAGYSNRGRILQVTGRLKLAEADWDETVAIYKQLADDFPNRPEFRLELSRSHRHRGLLLSSTGRLKEAEADFDLAISLQKQIAAKYPTRSDQLSLALSHDTRASLYHRTGRPTAAEKDYDEAVTLLRKLAADFPARPEFRLQLAKSLCNRGRLMLMTGRFKEAETNFDAALAIQKPLAAELPARPECRQDLAGSYLSRGTLLAASGRQKEGGVDLEAALGIYRQLVAEFPNQPELSADLAGACMNLAFQRQLNGDNSGAKKLLVEGHPNYVAALKSNPRNPQIRQYYRNHLYLLILLNAALLEKEEAVRTAETRRDVGWDPPADAYDAAGILSLCIPIVSKHEKLNETQRKEAEQSYTAAAMKVLREAVGKGFRNAAKLKTDEAFASLQENNDFKKLLAELESSSK